MLKLARRARGHFVTLIEIRVHLIRVKPGNISVLLPIDQMQKWPPTNYSFVFVLISLTSLVLQPKFFQFHMC